MEQPEYDDLLRRLTALVVKLDERDEEREQRLAQHAARMDRMQAMLEELQDLTKQQVEFNKQQRETNARLETLMTRVFQERSNGQETE